MKIAILPGDGIGPEIVGAGARVLDVLRARGSCRSRPRPRRSAARRYDAAGIRCRRRRSRSRSRADAVLLGAVGGPQYDTLPREHAARAGAARASARRSSCSRTCGPALLYPELAAASSLKPEVVAGLDLLIVRELTGDIYFGQPRGRRHERGAATTKASTRCSTACPRSSASRAWVSTSARASAARKLCSVDKANVLDTSILWREVGDAARARTIRTSR